MSIGKGSSSPPPAPSPTATASAQAEYNRQAALDTAALNRINETTPFGTASYTIGGHINPETGAISDTHSSGMVPIYERNVTLSPEQQALYNTGLGTSQQLLDIGQTRLGDIENTLGTSIDYSGLPSLPDLPSVPGLPDVPDTPQANEAVRQQVEDALYNRATSRLDPQFEQQQRRLETQLVNQGFDRGSEAFRREMEDFGRQRTDAYGQARNEAIMAGGAEQSRLFGLEMDAATTPYALEMDRAVQQYNMGANQYGMAQNARERALQELYAQRAQPINELSALAGQSGGVTLPSFSPVSQAGVAAPDYLGAAALQQQQLNQNYNSAQQQQQNFYGNLFGLGGAGLSGWAYGGFA